MTNWVQTLAEIPCPECQKPHECTEWDYLGIKPGDPEYDACICFKPCSTCSSTEALVPGLRRKCPKAYWKRICPNCQGRGWTLIPMVEQLGMLARTAYKLGFRVSGHWSSTTQLYYTILSVESDHLWFGEGDTPEESLAHAIFQAQGIT